jgi:hypothetical protein
MAYLNCPWCPAQSVVVGTIYIDLGLIKYQCLGNPKHSFFIDVLEAEREKEIESESIVHIHPDIL